MDQLTTDSIMDVYEHLSKNPTGQVIAGNGVNPDVAARALACITGTDPDRRHVTAAFALGLQIGAMRLEPIEFKQEDEPECQCILCAMERIAKQAMEEGGGEVE